MWNCHLYPNPDPCFFMCILPSSPSNPVSSPFQTEPSAPGLAVWILVCFWSFVSMEVPTPVTTPPNPVWLSSRLAHTWTLHLAQVWFYLVMPVGCYVLPVNNITVPVFRECHLVYFMSPDQHLSAEGHQDSCQNENSGFSLHTIVQRFIEHRVITNISWLIQVYFYLIFPFAFKFVETTSVV